MEHTFMPMSKREHKTVGDWNMFTGLVGRDFIDTAEWTREELNAVLDLANDLRGNLH